MANKTTSSKVDTVSDTKSSIDNKLVPVKTTGTSNISAPLGITSSSDGLTNVIKLGDGSLIRI